MQLPGMEAEIDRENKQKNLLCTININIFVIFFYQCIEGYHDCIGGCSVHGEEGGGREGEQHQCIKGISIVVEHSQYTDDIPPQIMIFPKQILISP